MLHRASRAARATAPRLARPYSSKPSASSSSALYAISGVAVGVGASTLWFLNAQPTTTSTSASTAAPVVKHVASVDDIAVSSPVKVLSLQEADRKLREHVRSFTFDAAEGSKGRVDVVRVSSNSPVEDEWAVGVGKGVGGAQTLFAGVYDGHAGWATSAVLKETLIPYVSTSLSHLASTSTDDTIVDAIKASFTALDDRIMTNAQRAATSAREHGAPEVISALAPAIAGSCALLAIYSPSSSTLRTAVTGDSRAVLGSWSAAKGAFAAETLTRDQTGFNAAEVSRLDGEHPGEKDDMLSAKTGRLLGLAVTRAFGDHRWKWSEDLVGSVQTSFWGYSPRPKAQTPPYLTARPEVTTRRVQAEDFVIMASDGLWDVMSNSDAVACVERWLSAQRAGKPEAAASEVRRSDFDVDGEGYSNYKSTPDYFAIEDLDSAAVCLAKNAFGGRRRTMFRGVMTAYSPVSRYVRDDVTVQVIFFRDPYGRS